MLDLLADREFFETFDRYEPVKKDFFNIVKKLLPDDWIYQRNGTWFNATPPDRDKNPLPPQGWKIHVSSSVDNGKKILRAVVPVLAKDNINFKFALDRRILMTMNGKAYGRQAAGKFITIYPFNEEHFKELIEAVHVVTKKFDGLYILSDKRYKDSRIVFYRYGGILPKSTINVRGGRTSKIFKPDGTEVEDMRVPYFNVPEWTKDPFAEEPGLTAGENEEAAAVAAEKASEEAKAPVPASAEITLKDGRYKVKFPLGYSNSGGVYIAEDLETGAEVVIKECRPFISTTKNSTDLLEKEYRILQKMADTGFVPKPVDFFQDWEHYFLVMERLPGTSLSSFSAGNNITLKTSPSLRDARKFYRQFKQIFTQLADFLRIMHERKIVFTDFSPNNVIVNPDTMEVKMIDFEGAYEVGVDKTVQLFTPGFVAPTQQSGQAASFESDWFALGASMHYFLSPINQMFAIYPKVRYTYIKSVIKDIGFPENLFDLIVKLIDKEPEERPSPDKVKEVLSVEQKARTPKFLVDEASIARECEILPAQITSYILSKADFSRVDRLFPADSNIFSTNPLSFAHGAVGIACSIKKMGQEVPQAVTDWILARNKHPDLYTPGLYIGLAGIAWGMLDLGLRKEATDVMVSTFGHRLLYDSHDLYYGITGWGLANLRFFAELAEERFLQKAIEAGEYLVDNLAENEKGRYWNDEAGIHLGYHFGGSGMALFLLYLYQASKKEVFLDVGKKLLDFELNNSSKSIDGGISWKKIVDQGRIVYPYLGQGSAGVGKAVARYLDFTGDEHYRDFLEKIVADTNRKYTVFPGLTNGISGLGDFLVDAYQVTGDPAHLKAAYRTASGLLLFKIEREEGVAFPGDGLTRISCDYSTGSAGIGRFLYRLANTAERSDFLLDGYFGHDTRAAGTSAA